MPNVGKSTFFNAITKSAAPAENYPFCTIEPNVGIVTVPDERIDRLAEIEKSGRKVPAIVEFVDIAGLVRGAAQGQGLGNKFLSHIREVDAIAMVVRCFEDGNVTHVDGSVDPVRDVETIMAELCLSDLEGVEKRLDKAGKGRRGGNTEALMESELLEAYKTALAQGKPAVCVKFEKPEQRKKAAEFQLLTDKNFLYIGNVADTDLANIEGNPHYAKLSAYVAQKGALCLPISAKIESEVAEMEDAEAAQLLADYGVKERGLHVVIRKAYETLDQISFFTAGEMESKAWTILKGTKAPEAAGKIHSDIEKGFIRAEVYSYEDLVEAGSTAKAREAGKLRIEGKEYIMRDGDVVHFRFAV
jgi:ribosome-binding ATPase